MAEREALAAAILSYDGPVDVSLPIHPAASETLRYRVEALADAILAALPDHVLISKEELERRIDEAHAFGYREGHRAALGEDR